MAPPEQQPTKVLVQFARESFDLLGEIADNLKRIAVALESRPAASATPAGAAAAGSPQPGAPNDGLTFRMGKTKGQLLSTASLNEVRKYAHFIDRTKDAKPQYRQQNHDHLAEVNAHLIARGSTAIGNEPAAPSAPPDMLADQPPDEPRDRPDGGPADDDIPF